MVSGTRAGAVVGAVALLAGCSSDVTQTDGGSAGDSGTSGAVPGDGETSGADETGGDVGDGGGLDETGNGDPGEDTGFGPGLGECDLDCGEGTCALDEDGLPECTCPKGSVSVGLTCLPCKPTDGPADVDIGGTFVSLRVLVDGDSAPQSDYEDGRLYLRDDLRGDEVLLGNSHDAGLGAMVLPGTYDLVWAVESGGLQVPRNTGAVLGRIQVRDGEIRLGAEGRAALELKDGVLIVDIPTVVVTGDFRLDGETPPVTGYENAKIRLADPATGDSILLGELREGEFSARVIAGSYEIRYEGLVSNGLAPINDDGVIGKMDVYASEVEPDRSIDVRVATFSGSFAFDGAPAPTSVYERGRISLEDVMTGDEIVLGDTSDGDFSVPVLPGSYDVVYTHLIGATVPRNARARVASIDLPAGQQVEDVDVPTTMVSGDILVGGAPAPGDPGNVGVVSLESLEGDDEVVLGTTASGSYAALVVDGTYDVFYRQQTSSGGVPLNTNARLSAAPIALPGETLGDIDIPFVSVSGAVTLDGAPPPTSEYDDARIYLRNAETGDSVLLGNTRMGQVGGLVVPGTYDIVYAVETAGATVPQNTGALLGSVVVPEGGTSISLPVDIPVAALAGNITAFGGPLPSGDADRANLVLEDRLTDDYVFLGPIEAGSFSAPVTPGIYVIWYELVQTTGQVPGNSHAPLACFTL